MTEIESEHLPPHVLVMFSVDKRQDVQDVMNQYADEILAVSNFLDTFVPSPAVACNLTLSLWAFCESSIAVVYKAKSNLDGSLTEMSAKTVLRS